MHSNPTEGSKGAGAGLDILVTDSFTQQMD